MVGAVVHAVPRPKWWYAVGWSSVANGVGIYSSWSAAKPFCIDPETDRPYKDAKFQKFGSLLDAAAFVNRQLEAGEAAHAAGDPASGSGAGAGRASATKRGREEDSASSPHSGTKKRKKEAVGTPVGGHGSGLHVYTDGSCIHNGKKHARAGYGVWFGEGDPRNESKALEGALQTNQRAELRAIKSALESTQGDARPIVIHSDSKYSMQCVDEWIALWRRNGWRTAKGGDVKNRDLIEPLDRLIRERRLEGGDKIRFVWVKGHSGHEGNDAADKLARLGADKHAQQRGGGRVV